MATVTFIKYKKTDWRDTPQCGPVCISGEKDCCADRSSVGKRAELYAPSGGPGVHNHPGHTPQG